MIPIMKTSNKSYKYQQNITFGRSSLQRQTMPEVLKIVFLSLCGFLFSIVEAGRGEIFETNKTAGLGQKNYEEQEEDKIVPHRTFLTTLEITVICVFTVIIVFLIVGLVIYVYFYGWNIPACCKKRNKDYSKVQLQRERKISEIWKNNY